MQMKCVHHNYPLVFGAGLCQCPWRWIAPSERWNYLIHHWLWPDVIDRETVPCESGFWTVEKWKVKKKCHSLFSRSANEKKWLEIEIEKWKWNENDWKSRSRSESEMKKLRDRDREVKFLENFREFKKDRFWYIGKGAFGDYIISLCNLLILTI